MGRSALNSGHGVFIGSPQVALGALSWSVGIGLFQAFACSRASASLCGAFIAGGSFQLLTRRNRCWGIRGFSLASISLRSWLALGYLILFGSVWPSRPTTGYSSTTLPRWLPSYVRQSELSPSCLLAVRGEAVTLNAAPFHGYGHLGR